jgi:hypothetical protein
MPDTDFEAPDTVPEGSPEVVGTPEGDNEFTPDEPLKKLPDEAEQVPRGGGPDAYRQPKDEVPAPREK